MLSMYPRARSKMRASFHASLTVMLGAVLGCTHASRGAEPTAAVAPPTSATPAPTAVPAIPPHVLDAKQILLRFTEHDHATLERARAIVDAFTAPERYEERGEVDGKPHYDARDTYEALGITVHRNGERITNVEPAPRPDSQIHRRTSP